MSSSPQPLRPAKIITPAIRQRLQERLTAARKLSRAAPCPHGQVDELLCECVIVDPGNTVYIGALLHHLRRSDRPAASFVSRLLMGDPLRAVRRAADAQDWEQVLTLGPPALCRRPKSVELLRHLATACAASDYEQAELCYLQAAASLAPDDAETQRQLARALTRQGIFDDAATAWQRVAEMVPNDEECRQTIKILSESEFVPPLLVQAEASEIHSAVERGTATREQVRMLFEHLLRRQRFSEAEKLLNDAITQFGRRLEFLECGEELSMEQSRWRVQVARRLAAFREDYRQGVARAEGDSARVHLQICQQRSDRHPGDVKLQLHLGRRLIFGGVYSEAVKLLEPIANIVAYRADAITQLAQAWYGLRQPEKVESCIQDLIRLSKAESNGLLVTDLFDRLKECAVAESDFAAARRFLDRRREFEATGKETHTS